MNFQHFMKHTITFRELQMAEAAFIGYSINKEETSRKHLIGWGHIVNFVWSEEAQRCLGI